MAALLKNQILKHLSKFAKNLSSDKINLSTLKGEGEMSNLELNEDILTQLLELPTWLRITKAVCNRVAVKIQWTKLKSQPICLYLDEVIVETETCEYPRPPNSQFQQAAGGKYGFVDRVMDGIYVHVNSVLVKLMSHKFHASLQLSRVKVQSMSPTWQAPSDLRSTRIRDPGRGEVLLFKEIEWQTTRIEATASGVGQDFLTPLRLIANQAKIRIVVKKRLSDSAIISSRLTLLLDDLLWVLTITQLKAAILYANSLKVVIERSAQQSKRLASEKLKKQGHMSDGGSQLHQHHHHHSQRSGQDRQESSTARYFSRFDVLSTSYHLITSRFDLHLCDDSSPGLEEKRHWKINGGSMQITFNKLSLDFYPFHPAGGERKAWHRYSDNVGSRNPWVHKLFANFREEAVRLRRVCDQSGLLAGLPSSSSAPSLLVAQPVGGAPPGGGGGRQKNLAPGTSHSVNSSPVHMSSQAGQHPHGSRSAQGSPQHQPPPPPRSTRLLETCFVVKVEDVTVYMVSMPGQKRSGPTKLVSSDKRQLHLPPDMSVLHVEFTDYFFPDGLQYPVPHPNLYVLVNPVRITLDFLTLLWSNVFLLTLSNSLDMDFGEQKPSEHVDIKLEMLMPRVIVPAEEKVENQPDRPEAVQVQVSKLVVTNGRTEDGMTRDDLLNTLNLYGRAGLFSAKEFPNEEGQHHVKDIIPEAIYQHADNSDDPYTDKAIKVLLKHVESEDAANQLSPGEPVDLPPHSLNCNSLKRLASQDVWSVQAEQLWLEFLGAPANKNRPVPFVEALPVTLWLSLNQSSLTGNKIGETVNGVTGKDHENGMNHNQIVGSEGRGCDESKNNSQPVVFRLGEESPAVRLHKGDEDQVGLQHPAYRNQQQHQTHHMSSPVMPVLGTSPPFSGSPVREDRDKTGVSSEDSTGYHPHKTRERVPARETWGNGKPRYNSLDRRQQGVEYYNDSENQGSYSEEGNRSSRTVHSAANGSYPSRKDQTRNYRYEDGGDPRESGSGQWDRDYGSPSNQRTRPQQRPVRRDSSAQGGVEGRQRYQQHGDDGDPSYGRGRESSSTEHAHSIHREQHRSRRDEGGCTLQRQDSRSSSSPPRQSDGAREHRGRERKLRHSSSSSSEKRDFDTTNTRTVGSRGRSSGGILESRSNAEGQVSSYSSHGMDEIQLKSDKRGTGVEDHFPSSDKRYYQGRDADLSTVQKSEVPRSSSSRGRHGSESPERSSSGGPARHRERHLQRSSSRDSRSGRENAKELPRRSPRADSARRSMTRDSPAGRRLTREPSRDSSDGRYDSCDQQNTKSATKSRKNYGHQGRTSAPHSGEDDNENSGRSSWGEDDVSGGRRVGRRAGGGGARQHRSQSRGSDRGDSGGPTGHRYPFPGRGENPMDIPRPRCMTEEVETRGPNYRNSEAHCDKDIVSQGGGEFSVNTDARLDSMSDGQGGYPMRDTSDSVETQHSRSRHECESGEAGFRGAWRTNQEAASSGWSQRHQRPPPDGCKSSQSQEDEEEEDTRWTTNGQQGVNPGTRNPNPDQKICVLLNVGSKLRVQLNHFQFVFLLRLAESFAAFQNDLAADLLSLSCTSALPPPPQSANAVKAVNSSRTAATITSSSTSQAVTYAQSSSLSLSSGPAVKPSSSASNQEPSSIIIIPIVLKELEFAVVCPYQMHQRTFSDDFSILSPFLQGVGSGQDAVFGDDGETGSTTCFPQFVDSVSKGSKYKEETSLKPFQHSISFKSQSANLFEATPKLAPPPEGHQRARSFINPAISHNSAQQSSVNMAVPVMNAGVNPSPFSFENLRKETGDSMSQSLNSKDSGIGIDRKSNSRGGQGRGASRGAGNSSKGGTSDMKKAFTSAFSSFTDKLKNKMDGTESDDLETMSIRTDTSDDDFEHLSLDDFGEEVPAFLPHDQPPADNASVNDNYSDLGDPGDSVSMYAESSTTKGKEMVYVVLFKLDHTEVCLENCENKTQARVQLAKLNTVQLGNISYDDFQTRFSSPKGYLQEDVSDSPPAKYPVRLRLDSTTSDPASAPVQAPEASGDHLTILAEDLSLQFKMSGLNCLSDFAEDEKISADTIPMSLDVRNLLLVLEEDRPPANVTSPGSLPTNLHIQQISVERGKDGIFYIAGYGNDPKRPVSQLRNPASASSNTSSAATSKKPIMVNAVTSPVTSPDGTMALLMASQNEAVLLRRQLEEVRRANRLYEHQLLQWRDAMASSGGRNPFTGRVSAAGSGGGGSGGGSSGGPTKKRSSFTIDSLSSSPASLSGSQQDCSSMGGGSSTVVGAARPAQGEEIDPARDELERENLQLQQRMAQLEEDLLTVSKEKESLLQTLQLLQDELLASERRQRARGKT